MIIDNLFFLMLACYNKKLVGYLKNQKFCCFGQVRLCNIQVRWSNIQGFFIKVLVRWSKSLVLWSKIQGFLEKYLSIGANPLSVGAKYNDFYSTYKSAGAKYLSAGATDKDFRIWTCPFDKRKSHFTQQKLIEHNKTRIEIFA